MRGRTNSNYWGVVLETPSAPALARFYADLLDWKVGKSEPDWATVGPQDDVRVLLDPDGHPFCLYLEAP